MNTFMAYPYLFANLGGLALVLVIVSAARLQRRAILASGLLAMTLAPWIWGYEHVYWTPRRILPWAVGIEDFLCAFVVGALSWAIAAIPVRKSIQLELRPGSIMLRRFLLLYLALCVMWVGLLLVGVKALIGDLLLHLAALIFLLCKRAYLWRMALMGYFGFGAVYTVLLVIELAIWPDFLKAWNAAAPWYWLIGGLPISEVVWSASFGATWPLVIAHAAAAKLRSGEAGKDRRWPTPANESQGSGTVLRTS